MVTLWDSQSGELFSTLSDHTDIVVGLAFNRADDRLASASFDRLAKIWDVETGEELFSLFGNSANVYGVSFRPEGTRLATAGTDGSLRTYLPPPDELIGLARYRLSRSLTVEECRKFLRVESCP